MFTVHYIHNKAVCVPAWKDLYHRDCVWLFCARSNACVCVSFPHRLVALPDDTKVDIKNLLSICVCHVASVGEDSRSVAACRHADITADISRL